ncbi:MAG TPA: glycoside hydrolase domain-containing protein [Phycisphaerae bacterium]|nr:glycoside hydrolase domain-containing protein [Phycisphaerae bacterium]
MSIRAVSAAVVVASVCLVGAGPAAAQAEKPAGKSVLDTESMWRMRLVWETEEVLLPSGKVEHAELKFEAPRSTIWKAGPTSKDFQVVPIPMLREPPRTPADWMQPGFDDSKWAYGQGPLLSGGTRELRSDAVAGVGWKLLLMRGRFEVVDPAAGGLTLSVEYKGGIVVYLNGQEIDRADMPAGPVGPDTCANPYDKAVWMREDGFGMKGAGDYNRYLKSVESDPAAPRRIRKLSDLKLPADKLRKGANVLAIAIHRPPARWELYATREKPYPLPAETYPRLGLHSVELTAPPEAAVASVAAGKDAGGLQAWNYSIARRVFTSFYKHAPTEQLHPVVIVGCRNGVFSGQLVLGSARPIKGLTVQVGDLTGPATIPAKAVDVRYALPDGWVNQGWMTSVKGPWFDGLEEAPPAETPVFEDGGGAVQPLWFRATVPADAKAGLYKADVRIAADGAEPLAARIELKVLDWALPDPKDTIADMDYFQSPDTVAMKYKVPFWSPRHWELMEKSFTEMERLSGRTLYITCIRQTQLGNQHAMVRWIRDDNGKLTPDTRIAEKYIDLAVKHMGTIKAVVLYCWAPPTSQGEYSAVGITHDREIYLSVLDPATGEPTEEKGPQWGSPESWRLWGKLTLAMKAVLKKRGLDDKMMYGLLGDHRATRKAMDDISAAAPKTPWALQSHTYCEEWQGKELGMCSAFWGIRAEPRDPSEARGHGWMNPYWLTYGPRDSTRTVSQIARQRTLTELWLTASATAERNWPKAVGVRGLSRIGIDFWEVLDKPCSQFGGLTIIGRYPETEWGHLSFARGTPCLLRPGANGAIPSIRSEAFRENLQEIEARVFLEKMLMDKDLRAKVGEELANRCQECLDKRTRVALNIQVRHTFSFIQGWPFYVTGLEDRTENLFALAAEVAGKLGQ